MSIYIPAVNPFKGLITRCINVSNDLNNIKYKRNFKKKKLKYDDIVRIEYNCIETPEMIFEDMCIDKSVENENDFKSVINVLKENNILNWKRNYRANLEYYDGCWWNIKITFKNNETFEASGDITFPKNFGSVYDEFEKYIITSDSKELNEIVINKWFKKNILL